MSENRYPPGYVPLTIHQLNGSADSGMSKPRKSNNPRSGQGRNDRRNDNRGDRNNRPNRNGGGDRRNHSRGRSSSQGEDFGNRDSRPRDSKLSFGSDNGNQGGGEDQD